jgi:protein gp37
MGETKIAWTDKTWNPVTGCTKVSPGCANCYAERFAERWRGIPGHAYENGFDLQTRPDRLSQPIRWTRPCMIFVCSMSDLFQDGVDKRYIDKVFDTMDLATHHVFQVLTKRPIRLRKYITWRYGGAPVPGHIWIGVTAEDQERANQRVYTLRNTLASVRFISAEPLLGPIKFDTLDGIDQVIVGGESGPGFRPMQLDWARDIRVHCANTGTAFFFKQHAGVRPRELGNKLDGVEYRELPQSSD